MNKKLYILIAVIVVLLCVTVALIFALRPSYGPNAEAVQTPAPEITLAPQDEPAPQDPQEDADDPLTGLSEEEMGALALAEEGGTAD